MSKNEARIRADEIEQVIRVVSGAPPYGAALDLLLQKLRTRRDTLLRNSNTKRWA